MSEKNRLRSAAAGSSEFAEGIVMMDAMREGLVSCGFDWTDPNTRSKAVAAAAMYAGMVFGEMVAAGFVRDQAQRLCEQGVLGNFRTGVKVGKRRAYRVAGEMGLGSVDQ